MKIIVSNALLKWKEESLESLSFQDGLKVVDVVIDTSKQYQTHMGFGGAFTDACIINYLKLDKQKREEVIKALFSKEGLQYNLARYPIHSTDFSKETYFYVDNDDKTLKTFSVEKDKDRLNLVKECLKHCPDMQIFASCWTPLPHMKNNNDPYHGGHLLKEYYQLWADYLAMALKAYEENGVHIDVLSPQNEPMASQVWESCLYTPEEEALFIKDYFSWIFTQKSFVIINKHSFSN